MLWLTIHIVGAVVSTLLMLAILGLRHDPMVSGRGSTVVTTVMLAPAAAWLSWTLTAVTLTALLLLVVVQKLQRRAEARYARRSD